MDVNIGGTFSGFPRILSVPAAIEDTTDLYRLARTSHPWGRAKKLDVCFLCFLCPSRSQIVYIVLMP